MKDLCLLLSGTPASGKDTLTKSIVELDDRFVHFKKHKIASGGKLDDTYYLVDKNEFDSMVSMDKFIQYHYRYDRGYGVSKKEFKHLINCGKIPVIHVGKYENISMFRESGIVNGVSMLIFTNRYVTEMRLKARHDDNSELVRERMIAYDEELKQLCKHLDKYELLDFDMIIENNGDNIHDTARSIISSFFMEHSKEDTTLKIKRIIEC